MNKQVKEGGNHQRLEHISMSPKTQIVYRRRIPIKGNRKTAFESYALYYGGIISCQA